MTNYSLLMENQISRLSGRPRLLLHSCCGPCSTAVLERLLPDFEVTLFFYNPNIRPESEYEKRLVSQRLVAEKMSVPLLERGSCGADFAPDGLEAEPEGGARCGYCFELRLGETARLAKERGFDFFTTTLTVSPHKNAALINATGESAAAEAGVSWLYGDFKKKEGYKRSIELSRELGLYRQEYCGCGLPADVI